MTEYHWYDEVPPERPLRQGDVIEECPVAVFDDQIQEQTGQDQLVEELRAAVAVEKVRAVVMTQQCDLEYKRVRNVILCPIYHLAEYRERWEEFQRERGQNPTENNWNKWLKEVKDGKVWNLAMLNRRDTGDQGALTLPPQIVDFHEIFSLPVDFLTSWARASELRRLQLQPPYREHLSQAFARFFMRVGLPQEIEL